MKFNLTPNLAIEDDDSEVIKLLDTIKINYHPCPVPQFLEVEHRGYLDWFFVAIEPHGKEHPADVIPDGILYIIQHFGKVDDSGYMAYILKDVFKNRRELDLVIRTMEFQPCETDFMQRSAEMVKSLRVGASLMELMKKGFLMAPPPHLN